MKVRNLSFASRLTTVFLVAITVIASSGAFVSFAAAAQSTTEDDSGGKFIERDTQHLRPYSSFDFGQPFWVEMLIGATVALPFSWLRFYYLSPCSKLLVHLVNDILEASLFWNELTMFDEGWVIFDPDEIENADAETINRNVYYLLVSNMSIMVTMPQLYNECSWSTGGST